MSAIIEVENLGKKYILRHKEQARYTALRDVMAATATKWGKKLIHPLQQEQQLSGTEEFWALRDVSFEVQQGDRVGIIGRNGAGKSTLLKILSRITEPTTGRARIRGRVASLLEVGTGFHPELTGRENIYLNGAILGMTRSEIARKFDEIVDFAEVERFLDTPVKRYSSGMYVRLAFAVAAHLEPEILIVDEVLAVGDAQFQKKCLGKMQDVGRDGRTVFFVSHNMSAIEQICTRGILLKNGCIYQRRDDSQGLRELISNYLNPSERQEASWVNKDGLFNNPFFTPLSFYIGDEQNNPMNMPIQSNETAYVYIVGNVECLHDALQVGFALYDDSGNLVYASLSTDDEQDNWPKISVGTNSLRALLPKRLLNEGIYRLELICGLYGRKWICQAGKAVPQITLSVQGGLSDSPYWQYKRPGIIAPVAHWSKF